MFPARTQARASHSALLWAGADDVDEGNGAGGNDDVASEEAGEGGSTAALLEEGTGDPKDITETCHTAMTEDGRCDDDERRTLDGAAADDATQVARHWS